MLYQSTRGKGKKISFEEAIIKGIADDGGLYVPERIPKVGADFIASLAKMDYVGAAVEIIKLFTENFTEEEIRDCASRAYNSRTFSDPDITPLHALDGRVNVMELYHGPTSAFKDLALQLLPPMLTMALQKTGVKEKIAILVATSGDTGKAALEGFKDVAGTSILVFYPKDGVSEAQKLQMVTQEGGNVAVAAVEGNFDDAQNGVKGIFADDESNSILREKGVLLSSANSINWGRLLPQIVYYFRAYATLLKKGNIKNGEPICFVVPTGNFGNILAGWYAREMGLPVSRFVCASNSNNVLADFIRTGVYDRNRDFMVTMSPAMDILISSNLERLLYELSGRDSESVARWMGELVRDGSYDVGETLHKKLSSLFYGGYASEVDTARAISETHSQYNYVLDTHTAVGIHVYGEYRKSIGTGKPGGNALDGKLGGVLGGELDGVLDGEFDSELDGKLDGVFGGDLGSGLDGEKVVVAATASPYKFALDVYNAIKGDSAAKDSKIAKGDKAAIDSAETENCEAITDDIQYIALLSDVSGAPIPESLRNLREKPVLHLKETTKEGMKETALSILAALGRQTDK